MHKTKIYQPEYELLFYFTGPQLVIHGALAPPSIMVGGQEAMITSNDLSSWTFDGIEVIGGVNVLALTNNKTEVATPKMIPTNGKSAYCSSQGAFAVECGIYPCVGSYKANIYRGNFEETLINTEPPFGRQKCFGMIKPSCLTEAQRRNVAKEGTPLSDADDWVPFCNSASFGISPDCYFELSQPSYYMLAGYFSSTLGSVSGGDTRIFNASVTAQNMTDVWSTVSGSAFLQNLYQSGNINIASYSTQISRMANSMTAFMRQNGAEGTTRSQRGRLVKTTTCVNVRWGWIALPATLALFTWIFLAFVIYISSFRSEGFVWKSSSLVVSYHGLYLEQEGLELNVDSDAAMMRTAKGMMVKMNKDDIQSRLIPTDHAESLMGLCRRHASVLQTNAQKFR
ncbi:hypothetical protein EJ08DRAFT_683413 [Tothia fuscella]|uniref:Uncharacterized protein n=1 Tax=Tothia fuscella TaxID=1048955 RepID=A0A9P4NG38_9PEZI|nr:hypothetical protein EJ08DRAFT_683413 [Tothia fuscella]